MIILSNEFIEVYDPYEAESVTWPINLLKACDQGKRSGGGSPPPPPAAPDPVATAQAQGAANRSAAVASAELAMINQFSPYGNLVYTPRGLSAGYTDKEGSVIPGTPQYTATQTLAPAQQQMLDLTNLAGINYGTTANRQLQAVSDRLAAPVDFTQFGDRPTLDYGNLATAAPQFDPAFRSQVSQGIRDRADIWQQRDLDRLETRLANQGINVGTDAWDKEMQRYQTGITDFNLAADTQALGQAQQLFNVQANARDRAVAEASQLFGLQTSDRDRAINELMLGRTQPLNELASMLSGSQVSKPTFLPQMQASIRPGDLQGAQYANYQGALNNYNQQFGANQAMQQGLQGGLFGLGSAALGAYGMSQYGRQPGGIR